jgi:2-polyprenyl-6-methoxyphenol hydroxylase-like FAD-dependent oxidoreductase
MPHLTPSTRQGRNNGMPTPDALDNGRSMNDRIGDHAVVVGASMAGLLAARALAEAYERVTIIERDHLPAVGEGRKAVPQGRHVHLLLPAGLQCLEALLPGLREQLISAGANPFQPDQLHFEIRGHEITRRAQAGEAISASRPLIEGHVRQRVLALPGIEVLEATRAVGLTATADGRRVSGVRLQGRSGSQAERRLDADLVVVATGRAGNLPGWLDALGLSRPPEEHLRVDLRYVTRCVHRRPGDLAGDKWVLIGARPGRPRTLVMSAVEGDRWLVTLAGYGADHHPPTDADGFMAFASGVAPPEVMETLRNAEPVGDIATHGFPANLRRRFEDLQGLPDGLLVCGDAVASFNPLYGQGMTVAALEAASLRDCLKRGARGLARRHVRAATKHVDHAWQMAVSGDLALPEVDGARPLQLRIMNAFTERLLRVAERDSVVATAFGNVVGMVEPPPHLMRPAVLLRVLRG